MTIKITTSSKIYADSLIKLSDDYPLILDNLADLLKIKSDSPELNDLINNPAISLDKKFEIIDEVLKSFDYRIVNFTKILISKNKFNELSEIIQAYNGMVEEINNIKEFEIVSAIELNDDLKLKIKNKLEQKYQKSVRINWTTDNTIIAGLIIKSDDEVIDGSIKNKLYKISKI